MLGWLTLIVAALAGLFVLLQSNGGGLDAMAAWPIAAGVLVLLSALYVTTLRVNWREARGVKAMAALLALAAAMAAMAFVIKDQPGVRAVLHAFDHTGDDLTERGTPGPVSVMIRRSTDGQFVAQGDINGTSATFLIDTGASAVMLKPSDAESAGIDVKALSFTTAVQTANGSVYAAPVRVRSLSIGLLHVTDIEALVAQPGSLNENLLGMSFLRRLSSYKLSGDFMTLRQ